MLMSISPVQLTQQVAEAVREASADRSAQAPLPAAAQASAPAVTAAVPTVEAAIPAAAVAPPAQFSTDLQVDAKHQLYYEVIDDSDGSVLFEIPSEALRAIGESLNLPLGGDPGVPSIDVKS
jgi:streptogramin lyase